MSENTGSTQLHIASWVLILVGGIIAIASQGMAIWGYSMYFQMLPMQPPEYVPLMLLSMQMMLMLIVVTVIIGTLLIIAAIIAYWKSPMAGGILAIIFSVGLFLLPTSNPPPSLIGWEGAILAIIGGILGIVSARSQPKSPEPEII